MNEAKDIVGYFDCEITGKKNKYPITNEHVNVQTNNLAVCHFQIACQDALADTPFFNKTIKFHSKALLAELLKTAATEIGDMSNKTPNGLWELVRAFEEIAHLLVRMKPEDIALYTSLLQLSNIPEHAAFFEGYLDHLDKLTQSNIHDTRLPNENDSDRRAQAADPAAAQEERHFLH